MQLKNKHTHNTSILTGQKTWIRHKSVRSHHLIQHKGIWYGYSDELISGDTGNETLKISTDVPLCE